MGALQPCEGKLGNLVPMRKERALRVSVMVSLLCLQREQKAEIATALYAVAPLLHR